MNHSKSVDPPALPLIRTNIPSDDLVVHRHQSYLYALETCWAKHFNIVLTPDHIWYTCLCEVAGLIRKAPEKFRSLFTTSAEKQEISLAGYDDAELIDLSRIATELQKLTPSDTSIFLPSFSTSTEMSRMGFLAAFADALSPYYNYSMYLCEPPCVRLECTYEDLALLSDNLLKMGRMVDQGDWALKIVHAIDMLFHNKINEHIFKPKVCGSGHDEEVEGWWTRMYMGVIKRPAYIGNFPTHLSEVVYKNLTTRRDFKLHVGILYSTVEPDGAALRPQFGFNLYETTPSAVEAHVRQQSEPVHMTEDEKGKAILAALTRAGLRFDS